MSETGDFQETFYEMLEETLDPDVNILNFSYYSQNFENIDYDHVFSKMAIFYKKFLCFYRFAPVSRKPPKHQTNTLKGNTMRFFSLA